MRRDAKAISVDRKASARVVVIGGGLGGVSAAWRVRAAGIEDVVLFEVEDGVGGVARTAGIGSIADVPLGCVALHAGRISEPWGRRLLADAGLLATASRTESRPESAGARPTERVFGPDGWTTAAELPEESGWISLIEAFQKRRSASRGTATGPSTAFADLDDLNVAQWLATEGRAHADATPRIERWCRARFGAPLDCVSAAALADDAVLRGANDGLPADVAGRGAATLAKELARRLGPNSRGAEVALRVGAAEGRASVIVANAYDARVTEWTADAVIFAVPAFTARRLFHDPPPALAGALATPRTPWLVTALELSRWPSGFDARAAFHVPRMGPSARLTHVTDGRTRVLVDQRPFTSRHVEAARSLVGGLDEDGALDYVLPDLTRVFPDISECAVSAHILRLGHGTARPHPGFLTKVVPALRVLPSPFWLAGSDAAGIPSADGALQWGVRAAEAALAFLGNRDGSWL